MFGLHRPPHRGRQAYRHIVVLALTMHDAHGAGLLVAILLEVPEFGYEVACQLDEKEREHKLMTETLTATDYEVPGPGQHRVRIEEVKKRDGKPGRELRRTPS